MTCELDIALSGVVLILLFVFVLACSASAANVSRQTDSANKFGVHEIVLIGNGAVPNPFETDCVVTFTPPSGAGNAVTIKAFYDDGDTWRARLYVTEIGRWTWSSVSSDNKLGDKSGSFTAEDSALRGKLRKHPANNHQWITDDGRTFLNLSDTAYTLFRSPNNPVQAVEDEVFQEYVKDNAALGITSMRAGGCGGYAGWSRSDVYGWSKKLDQPYDRTNWCWEKDYGQPDYWESFDLDRLQTTDRRLEWLLNNYPDMYIQLIMFGKIWHGLAERWYEIPQMYRKKTIDYLIARWSAWPQVHYLIVNDTNHRETDADNLKMIRGIGNHVAEIEPFGTLVSAGVKRRVDNPFVLQSDWDNWHTYLHIEKYAEIDASVCEYYYDESGYNVPVHLFYGEDWYESDRTRLKDVRYYYRRMFWSVLLSGGSPNYGGRYPVIQPYHKTGEIPFPTSRGVCTNQLVGLNDNLHIKDFFEERGIDLALFAPDDGAIEAIPAPSPEPNGPSRAQCAHRDYEEYLIYLPCASDGEMTGGDEDSEEQQSRCQATLDTNRTPGVRVDLRNASGEFRIEWYRPTDGVSQSGSSIPGGDYRTLTSPWQGVDVVLWLVKDALETFDMSKLTLTDIHPHRGGGENPENTLYGFKRNLRDGVSLDMDIRKTADGDIVVTHDKTTGRACDKNWVVAQKTVAELKTLDASYLFDPKSDESFPLRGRGIIIPTLAEVFRLFSEKKSPGATMWIDTKDDESYTLEENQGLYDRLIELIGEYDLWNEAHIEVARTKEAEALRSRDPRVRVVFWAWNADEARNALNYPHYIRIGVKRGVAASVADQVRASGRKLHVYDKRYTQSGWDELKPHKPDSLGTEYYKELIELVGAD